MDTKIQIDKHLGIFARKAQDRFATLTNGQMVTQRLGELAAPKTTVNHG